VKMYTDDIKYRGDSDSIVLKTSIFLDCYRKANILEDSYVLTFSIMLRGLARDFYFSDLMYKNLLYTDLTF
jgi:hypothetical protein